VASEGNGIILNIESADHVPDEPDAITKADVMAAVIGGCKVAAGQHRSPGNSD